MGTVDFTAPEQLLKGESSVQGGVYSLGKFLRTCCGGVLPRSRRQSADRAGGDC